MSEQSKIVQVCVDQFTVNEYCEHVNMLIFPQVKATKKYHIVKCFKKEGTLRSILSEQD